MSGEISEQVILKAARESDPDCLPEHIEKKIRVRLRMTWGGLVTAVGGTIVGILGAMKDPVELYLVIIGFVAALIGAGSLDPSLVVNFFRRQS